MWFRYESWHSLVQFRHRIELSFHHNAASVFSRALQEVSLLGAIWRLDIEARYDGPGRRAESVGGEDLRTVGELCHREESLQQRKRRRNVHDQGDGGLPRSCLILRRDGYLKIECLVACRKVNLV